MPNRLRARKLPDDINAIAIRAVGGVEDEAVLDVLIRYTITKRRFLWFWWMASKSPAMLEALANLSVHWRYHPRAAGVLKRGTKHRDKEVRQAAGARARLRRDDEEPRLKVMI